MLRAAGIGRRTIEIRSGNANFVRFKPFLICLCGDFAPKALAFSKSPPRLEQAGPFRSTRPMLLHTMQAAGLMSANVDLIKAAMLGFVEGLTEYLPVSSTGHLLLMERILGWGDDAFGKSFAILIQLGAILALLSIYFGRLWNLARNMFTDWAAARFVIGVLLAFLPAAVIGALAYPIIKAYLFDVRVVCIALIIGGFILIWVDRLNLNPRYHEATGFSLPMYLGIGICQCFSMIPGVSRAGATIVGAMLFGADRRSAAEFSFWLAMPTMVGAFAYEAFKDRAELAHASVMLIAVGFVCSFVFGWIVVKTFLSYVQHHTFSLFAWWRIVLGAAGLLAIYFV
jgi:undecaprenyl-diphosphatase